MQHFAIQKSSFFTCYDVALLFLVFSKLVCYYVQKQVRSNIHVTLKAHISHEIYFYGI